MAIWVVYALASVFLVFLCWQLPQDTIPPIDLVFPAWIPFPLDVLIAIGFVVIFLVLFVAITSAVACLFIHTIWILFGAWSLSRSVHKTWSKWRKEGLCKEEMSSYREVSNSRLEHQIDDLDEAVTNAEDLIELDRENDSCNQVSTDANTEQKRLYQELDRGKKDIRLLRPIVEDTAVDVLRFEMVQMPLNDASCKYMALSYRWGTPSIPTKEILIKQAQGQDIRLPIRQNLYQGLRRVIEERRRLTETWAQEHIWVDALCINQADPEERDAQVALMRIIFSKAQTVVCWIPNSAENDLQQWPQNSNGHAPAPTSISGGVQGSLSVETAPRLALMSSYWKRLWIVQEVASAREIKILTDDGIVHESVLQASIDDAGAEDLLHTLERVKNVMDIRERCRSDNLLSLIDLLLRTNASLCGNRHDRVFGILSMARDERRFITEPSYQIPETDPSTRMTRLYLDRNKESNVDIILLGAGSSRNSDLPSWCPNYCGFDLLPPDRRLFEYVRDLFGRAQSLPQQNKGRPLFHAAGVSICGVTFRGNDVLCTPAVALGKINSLGWIASDPDNSIFPTREAGARLDMNEFDIATALWRLLLTLSQRDFWESQLGSEQPLEAGNSTSNHDFSRLTQIPTAGLVRRKKTLLERRVPSSEDPLTRHDYETCTYPFVYFMLLVFSGGQKVEEAGTTDNWYTKWLLANQNFYFGQRKLHQHAENMSSVLGQLHFWKWAKAWKDTLFASTLHTELRDRKRIHQPLETVAKQHMRLMSININGEDILGLAHPAAQHGDEVFLLAGCSVPTILHRDLESNPYSVVGDAIIPGAMFGERWSTSTREVEIR